jgi:S-DNA-T family DNA segregation ATPase FtsK/SpoIIIE
MLNSFFGPPTLILTLIPLAILVRIFVRTSRWSILKVLAIALSGAILSSVWFFYASIITNVNLGGEWGKYIGLWLAQKMGDASAFYLLSGALILWIMLSSLDFIISGARYFINKPYVREIVVEVEKEVSPVPEEKEKQSRKKSRKKAPTPDPDPEPKKAISSEDDLKSFKTPSEDLLKARTAEVHKISQDEIRRNIETIRETLADHHIQVVDIQAVTGPTVTLYRIYPEKGVKVSAVRNLHEDIAVALNAGKNVRVLTLDDCVGMEVPNKTKSIVPVRSLIESAEFRQSDYELPIAIGRTVEGKTKVFDLADAPHLLVAGATKQGKSVGLNVIVASLLYGKRPSELKMVFIDPKGTEFNSYKNLYKHYLAVMPTASNEEEEKDSSVPVYPKEADTVLRALCQEMKERYELLRIAGATPDIQTYNRKFREKKLRPDKGHKFLPYIVAIIDEYAQLTLVNSGKPEARNASRSITSSIISLAQMGRAAGIHVIIATQTPRKDVISGMIKANFPTMIAFKVSNSTDSQVILDNTGAEKLIGKGDMLISQNAGMERVQCGYIGPDEIKSITDNIAAQTGVGKSYSIPYYLPEVEDENEEKGGGMVDMKKLDSMFEDAARTVITTGRASTSYLQTTLGMGFARAARVMSQLEAAGIVGPQDGKAKNREVLVQTFEELDRIINAYTKS